MKEFIEKLRKLAENLSSVGKARAAALAFALLLPIGAHAQTVTQQPQFVAPNAVLDLGPGPMELRAVSGNGQLFTGLGTGVGSTSGSSTTLTLTGTPAIPPRVGAVIQGTGIVAGTTVAAFNGTTTITLSAAMTVPASTALTWGAACASMPTTVGKAEIQTAVGGDLPLFTLANVCLSATNSPGLQFLQFALGAH